MLKKMNLFFTKTRLLVLYWLIFWFMNGLDKFLNRQNLNIFTWYGKDRSDQFGGYFLKTNIPEAMMNPLLYLTGVWELVVAIPMIITLWGLVFYRRLNEEMFKAGMFWGGATFVGFAFFDIIFGDRAELLEHSTFLILIVVTYRLVLNDKKNNNV